MKQHLKMMAKQQPERFNLSRGDLVMLDDRTFYHVTVLRRGVGMIIVITHKPGIKERDALTKTDFDFVYHVKWFGPNHGNDRPVRTYYSREIKQLF
jgi:hypothetical protein